MSDVDKLDVVIRHRDEKIIAGIPQIGLYAKGDSVSAALAALDMRKKAFVADLEEAGELELLNVEYNPTPLRRGTTGLSGDLKRFVMKAGIVVCCVVATIVISGALIASKVEGSIERTVSNVKSIKVGGSQFWTQIENELDRMAQPGSDLPQAKKQKLLADIHTITTRWHPFIAEIQSALAEANNSMRPPAASDAK